MKKLCSILLATALCAAPATVMADDYDAYDYDFDPEDDSYDYDDGYDNAGGYDEEDSYDGEDDTYYDDSDNSGYDDSYGNNNGSTSDETIIPASPNGNTGENPQPSASSADSVGSEDIDWNSLFQIPSDEEIASYQNPNNTLAPYVMGWMTIPEEVRYTEFSVEFKADYLPEGTYCALGSWKMDYSSLESQYTSVNVESTIHGYAGFQRRKGNEMVGIMSFWDVYCTDANGNQTTIRATRIYPENTDDTEDFGGEGTGAHCLVPYQWESGHWYRMHLVCGTSSETGNTTVEQWVEDLETNESAMLCKYDVGVKNSCFKGSTAFFLENYLPEFAGEVRSMEVRGAKYLDESTGQWQDITQAYMAPNGGLPTYEGSYNFGALQDCFWMITSGIGGDWYGNGTGKQGMYVDLQK